jgi:predicted transcriptional regulator of viral defense system
MRRVTEAVWSAVVPTAPVFTTADVAAAAAVSGDRASRDLGLLARRGLVVRITRGVWADTRSPRFSPYAVVPALLRLGRPARGYVSLLSALSLHGMITQIPRRIYVVSDKRMRRVMRTSIGTYEFYTMQQSLVDGFRPYRSGTFDIAVPEKAVFDVLYYSVRKGTRFARLSEVSLPHDFAVTALMEWVQRIGHPSIRRAVSDRWRELRHGAGRLGAA